MVIHTMLYDLTRQDNYGLLKSAFVKVFLFVFFFSIFLVLPVKAYAATYYVDATGGLDSNNGTSTSTAFKTMAKLAGFGFAAGDQVLLKKGEVWRETWYVNTGGSSGNPITYGSYGAAVAKPRITGTDLVTGWSLQSGNIYKANYTNSIGIYLLLEDSTMATPVGSLAAVTGARMFWFDDTNNVVYYWASDGANPSTHTIEIGARYDVVSSDDRTDITFNGLQIDGAGGQYGRGFGLKPTWNTPSNITLQNMKITNNYFSGVWAAYATNFTPISNFKVYTSDIDHNGVFGMRIEGQSSSYRMTGFRLDGSHVYNNGLDHTSIGQIGVWLNHLSAPIITGSTLNDNQGFLDWSDNLYTGDTKNALVEKNIFYNGYKTNAHFDADSNGFIFRYNISYGAGWNGVWVEEHLRANGVSYIYNNVLYNNLHGFVFGPGGTAFVVSGVVVKNNIFAYNTRASDDLNNTNSDNDVDYNIYYTDGSAQGQFRYGGAFVDFATWKTDTGWDAHSTFAEPSFLNRGSSDFHLTSSSPAINAGTDLSLTSDFAGTTVPQGSAPDDGAYEFILPSAPSSLAQYKSDGTTTITSAAWTNETTVVLNFKMSSSNSSDSLTPQVEVRTNGTAFTNVVTNSGSAVAYSGPSVTGTVTITGLTQGASYHWQARINNSAGAGSWVSSGGNPDFSVMSPPSSPSSLAQYQSDGTTSISSSNPLGVASTAVLKFSMSSTNSSDSLTPQVEIQHQGTAFTNTSNYSGSAISFTGTTVTGTVTIPNMGSGSFHWQARVSNSAGQSSWVSMGGNSDFSIEYSPSSSSNSFGSSPSVPSCGNTTPTDIPDLFQIDATSTTAKLYFTTLRNNVSGYAIAYGFTSNDERFGTIISYNGTRWIIDTTINDLSPNTTYYFKIKPVNGCTAGKWSKTLMAVTTGSKSIVRSNYPSFLPGIKRLNASFISQPVVNKPLPFNTAASNQPTNINPTPKPSANVRRPEINQPAAPRPTSTPTKHCIWFICW